MTLPFAAISPSDALPARPSPRLQRTEGAARISFKWSHGGTRLDRLHQSGAAKIRLPNVFGGEPQAVLINTAGGLTGGDRMSLEAMVGDGCRAVLTTQACEKLYRASTGSAEVRTRLVVGEGARLDWLPQETILFDGARLSRHLEAELAPGAELLLTEAVIFGRTAHGETIRSGLFTDRWRVRQGDALIFADDLRFDWADTDLLHRPAVLAGATAMATILFVTGDPGRHLEAVRAVVGEAGGASAWNGKLLVRIAAESGASLRKTLIPALEFLLGGAALPRIWQI